MTRLPSFSDLRFSSKMLLLVGLLGLLAVVITAYALTSMRGVNQQYRSLIAHEGRGALTIAEASRHLDSASRLAYAVLTEPDEARMLASLGELRAIKSRYDSDLRKLQEVLPTKSATISGITTSSQSIFETAERIIAAAARWRGDQALQIIHGEFEPGLRTLRSDMDGLRDGAISQFNVLSDELSSRTAHTILVTALAVVAALVVVIWLSLYVAIAQMSRPLAQLTRTMERMSQRDYDDAIVLTGRRDEVGQMAKALSVFQRSMQREDRLAVEVAASEQARRLSEQLVDLISAIPGAVFQMHVAPDGQRRILFASERAAQLHGRTVAALQRADEPAGREFLHANAQDIQLAHTAFVSSVQTLSPLDFDTKTALNGKTWWFKTLATARRTADGGAMFNGVWLDVTEQKNQAQALTQAKNFAEKAAADKARFLATMSHEIRTPLNAILGMTQLAMHHETQASQRERIAMTLRAGQHLLNIVNNVLDLSKIEARKLEIARETFSTRQWLEELRDLFVGEAQAKGLDLRMHLAPGTPERVCGDRQRMSQVLINYLNNAIKFTQTGTITLSIDTQERDRQGAMLRGQVQDTGIGIAESQQEALFLAFEQGDSSITRGFGGTGLGLAISRHLAELMGGAAGVISAPGKGSTFWFTARVDAAESEPNAPRSTFGGALARVASAPNTAAPHFGSGTRVLLVDDNEINRAVARGMLELGGLVVDEAGDGVQALAQLEASADETYALVFMDMQMPTMDGLSATRALRKNPRFTHLPVIALTANASEDDIARTREAGMNSHLTKPLLEEALWRCVRAWLPPPRGEKEPAARCNVAVLHELRASLGDDRAFAMVAVFLADCEARLVRMQDFAQKNESSALAEHAHDLSGSAGCFGLERLGDSAHRLCARVSAGDTAGASQAFIDLWNYARVDLNALRRYCENHATRALRGEAV